MSTPATLPSQVSLSAPTSRKSRVPELTMDEKMLIIEEKSKPKASLRSVARTMTIKLGRNVTKKQVEGTWNHRAEITQFYESNTSGKRRRIDAEPKTDDQRIRQQINDHAFRFFKMCNTKNLPVSGPVLQECARQVASALGMPEHAASDGWLNRFRKRHNVLYPVQTEESTSVTSSLCNDWEAKLAQYLTEYALTDIFNCGETGLLYKQTPSKSLIEVAEKCSAGKNGKERLTVLLCASSTGEKLKPLVIGRVAKPKAFQQACLTTDQLPVTWRSNKKALMMSSIFSEWLHIIDKLMRSQKRQILLLLDDCSAHLAVEELQNVKLLFIPRNAALHPFHQGIITSFKLHYRKLLLDDLVERANQLVSIDQFTKSISVLTASLWIDRAWNSVQRGTVTRSFMRCGIGLLSSITQPVVDDADEWNQLSEMFYNLSDFPATEAVSVEQYIAFDDLVETSVTQSGSTMEELVDVIVSEAVTNKDKDDTEDLESEEDVKDVVNLSAPSKAAIASHFSDIRRYAQLNNAHDICSQLLSIEAELNGRARDQTKIQLKEMKLQAILILRRDCFM